MKLSKLIAFGEKGSRLQGYTNQIHLADSVLTVTDGFIMIQVKSDNLKGFTALLPFKVGGTPDQSPDFSAVIPKRNESKEVDVDRLLALMRLYKLTPKSCINPTTMKITETQEPGSFNAKKLWDAIAVVDFPLGMTFAVHENETLCACGALRARLKRLRFARIEH